MKKLILMSIILVSVFVAAMAQVVDTTQVVPAIPPAVDANTIASLIPAKWLTIISAVATVLWLVSEALGNIASVKANSVYQLVTGWLKLLLKK